MRRALCIGLSLTVLAVMAGCEGVPTETPESTPIDPTLAVGSDTTTGASIATDKDDYAPGDTVRITGTGWAAGEPVHFRLARTPQTSETNEWDVEADGDGRLATSYVVLDTDLGVKFTLTATGPTSGSVVETIFTDGTVLVRASAGVTFSLVVVGQYNNATCSGTSNGSESGTYDVTSSSFQKQGDPSKTSLSIGNGNSAKLTPPAASNQGGNFQSWTTTQGNNGSNLIVDPAPSGINGPREVCIVGGQGTTTFTATYAAPQAAPTTLTVDPASGTQGGTVTLRATLTKTSDGSVVAGKTISFTLNGTAASPTATATTNASGVATLTGVSLSGIVPGSYPTGVGASFAGDASFGGSSGTAALTIAAGTGLTTASATGTYGGTTILQATLTSGGTGVSGKTITFQLNGTAVCGATGKPTCPSTNASGVATLSNVSLAGINAGTHTDAVVATFAGDATHAGTSDAADLTVEKAGQIITFDISTLSKTFGDPDFTISATGGGSGNPVTFESLTTGKCTVSGNTVSIVEAGLCKIKASQEGDDNYHAAPDVESSFTIQQAATTTEVASSKPSSTYGESVTFTATVKPAVSGGTTLGTVQFKKGNADLGSPVALGNCTAAGCTATLQIATLTAAASPHSIGAVYSGNVNFLGSTATAITQTVNPAPLTGTADDKSRVFGAPDPAFTVTYSGFVLGEQPADVITGTLSCTTDATATTPVADSPGEINCSGQSAANYTITYQPGKLAITAAGTAVTLGTVPAVVFGQSSVALSATVSAQSPSTATVNEGAVTFTITQGSFSRSVTSGTVSGGAASANLSLTGAPVGGYSVGVTYNPAAGIPNFTTSTATRANALNILYNTAVGHAFLQPINPNLTTGNRSTFKVGSTIPTKFQLFLADGVTPIATAHATISIAKLDNSAPGVINEDVIALPADAGTAFRYDASGQQYIFNLGTKSWTAGTYKITATLDDGSTINAEVDGRAK